jgi:prepilin-type N-terminal cleavage/methylation domain-containing protein
MTVRRGMTLIELLVVMAILAVLIGGIATVALRASGLGPVKAAAADIQRIALALDAYKMDFRKLPPDTGFGLDIDNPPVAKDVYDPGSLWRYLVVPVHDPYKNRVFGPYLEWDQDGLVPYNDGRFAGQSYYLADPWGNPYGYVGDPKRVIHNQGMFDLWSSGTDGFSAHNNKEKDGDSPYVDVQTTNPMSRLQQDNRAYNGQDDDRNGFVNGFVDDANEFGPEATQNGDVGDDINNWSTGH